MRDLLWKGALSITTRLFGRRTGNSIFLIQVVTVRCVHLVSNSIGASQSEPRCHDQIGAVMVFAADPAEDAATADGPAMRAVSVALKAAFVEIYHVGFAVLGDPKAQRAQECYSFLVMTFRISRRFF
jgi:hypothetical protein